MTSVPRLFFVLISKNAKAIKHRVSDEELVEQIVVTKSSLLFSVLYDRYSKKVYNKCYSFAKDSDEAKDLTQEVFLKLFTKLHSFNGTSKFSTWLYAFTYNFCVNYSNRDTGKKMKSLSDAMKEHEYHLFSDNDLEIVDEETLFQLKASKLTLALDQIDPMEKALLLLKYQDDVSIKEMMVIYGIGESAIKMRLKRAKQKLIAVHTKSL
ncbi:RNA polymerase sigma factor [Aquimarina addita]|uniref:RNA polymerase sigma factor n=1 Tax=Aquimarina addita TaxID=870485 RepID=A0ABP6UVI8_9FLAO